MIENPKLRIEASVNSAGIDRANLSLKKFNESVNTLKKDIGGFNRAITAFVDHFKSVERITGAFKEMKNFKFGDVFKAFSKNIVDFEKQLKSIPKTFDLSLKDSDITKRLQGYNKVINTLGKGTFGTAKQTKKFNADDTESAFKYMENIMADYKKVAMSAKDFDMSKKDADIGKFISGYNRVVTTLNKATFSPGRLAKNYSSTDTASAFKYMRDQMAEYNSAMKAIPEDFNLSKKEDKYVKLLSGYSKVVNLLNKSTFGLAGKAKNFDPSATASGFSLIQTMMRNYANQMKEIPVEFDFSKKEDALVKRVAGYSKFVNILNKSTFGMSKNFKGFDASSVVNGLASLKLVFNAYYSAVKDLSGYDFSDSKNPLVKNIEGFSKTINVLNKTLSTVPNSIKKLNLSTLKTQLDSIKPIFKMYSDVLKSEEFASIGNIQVGNAGANISLINKTLTGDAATTRTSNRGKSASTSGSKASVVSMFDTLKSDFTTLSTQFSTDTAAALSKMVITDIPGKIQPMRNNRSGGILQIFQGMFAGLKSFMGTAIPNLFGNTTTLLGNFFTNLGTTLKSKEFAKFKNSLKTFFRGVITDIKGFASSLGDMFLNVFDTVKSVVGYMTFAGGGLTASFIGMEHYFKSFTTSIIQSAEKYRGYNIALLGMMKTQENVNSLMKNSMEITKDMPISMEQTYSAIKGLALIGPVRSMLKSPTQQGPMIEDAMSVIMGLNQLEPEWGIQGAMFSLREALAGDWVSLKRRFELPVNTMKTRSGKKLTEVTDPLEGLRGLKDYLAEFYGKEGLEKIANNFSAVLMKMEGYWDIFRKQIAESGIYQVIVDDLIKIRDTMATYISSADMKRQAAEISRNMAVAYGSNITMFQNIIKNISSFTGFKMDTTSLTGLVDIVSRITEGFARITIFVAELSKFNIGGMLRDGLLEAWKTLEPFGEFLVETFKAIGKDLDWVSQKFGDFYKEVSGKEWKSLDPNTTGKGLFYLWLFGPGNILTAITSMLNLIFAAITAAVATWKFTGPFAALIATGSVIHDYAKLLENWGAPSTEADQFDNIRKATHTFLPISTKDGRDDPNFWKKINTPDWSEKKRELAAYLAESGVVGGLPDSYVSSGLDSHAVEDMAFNNIMDLITKMGDMKKVQEAQLSDFNKQMEISKTFYSNSEILLSPVEYLKSIFGMSNTLKDTFSPATKSIISESQKIKDMQKQFQAPVEDLLSSLPFNTRVTSTTGGTHEDPGHKGGWAFDFKPSNPLDAKNRDYMVALENSLRSNPNVEKWYYEDDKKGNYFDRDMISSFGKEVRTFKYTRGSNIHVDMKEIEKQKKDATELIETGIWGSIKARVISGYNHFKGAANKAGSTEFQDITIPEDVKDTLKQSIGVYTSNLDNYVENLSSKRIESLTANLESTKNQEKPYSYGVSAYTANEQSTKDAVIGMWDLYNRAIGTTIPTLSPKIIPGSIGAGIQSLVGTGVESILTKSFIDGLNSIKDQTDTINFNPIKLIKNFNEIFDFIFKSFESDGLLSDLMKLSKANEMQAVKDRTANIDQFASDILASKYTNMNPQKEQVLSRQFDRSLLKEIEISDTTRYSGKESIESIKKIYGDLATAFSTSGKDMLGTIDSIGQGYSDQDKIVLENIKTQLKAKESLKTFVVAMGATSNKLNELDFTQPEKYSEALQMLRNPMGRSKSLVDTGYNKFLEAEGDINLPIGDVIEMGLMKSQYSIKSSSQVLLEIFGNLASDLSSVFETNFTDVLEGKLRTFEQFFDNFAQGLRSIFIKGFSSMLSNNVMEMIFPSVGNFLGGQFTGGGSSGNRNVGSVLTALMGGGNVISNIGTVGGTNSAVDMMMNMGISTSGVGGIAGNSSMGSLGSASGGSPNIIKALMAGGSYKTMYKAMGLSSAWALPAVAAGMYLTQPGRLFGGIIKTKSLEAAEKKYESVEDYRTGMMDRRLGDASRFQYAAAFQSPYVRKFGSTPSSPLPMDSLEALMNFQFAAPTIEKHTSGGGTWDWLKGLKKEEHGSTNTVNFESSMKSYYSMMERLQNVDLNEKRRISHISKFNDIKGLEEELKVKNAFKDTLKNQYTKLEKTVNYSDQNSVKGFEEARDKYFEALEESLNIGDEVAELRRTTANKEKEYLAFNQNMFGQLTDVGMQNFKILQMQNEISYMEANGGSGTSAWYDAMMEMVSAQKDLTDTIRDGMHDASNSFVETIASFRGLSSASMAQILKIGQDIYTGKLELLKYETLPASQLPENLRSSMFQYSLGAGQTLPDSINMDIYSQFRNKSFTKTEQEQLEAGIYAGGNHPFNKLYKDLRSNVRQVEVSPYKPATEGTTTITPNAWKFSSQLATNAILGSTGGTTKFGVDFGKTLISSVVSRTGDTSLKFYDPNSGKERSFKNLDMNQFKSFVDLINNKTFNSQETTDLYKNSMYSILTLLEGNGLVKLKNDTTADTNATISKNGVTSSIAFTKDEFIKYLNEFNSTTFSDKDLQDMKNYNYSNSNMTKIYELIQSGFLTNISTNMGGKTEYTPGTAATPQVVSDIADPIGSWNETFISSFQDLSNQIEDLTERNNYLADYYKSLESFVAKKGGAGIDFSDISITSIDSVSKMFSRLRNTMGNIDLSDFSTQFDSVFTMIENLNNNLDVYTALAETDEVKSNATKLVQYNTLIAGTLDELASYYQNITDTLRAWIKGGVLENTVYDIVNMTEDEFKGIQYGVNKGNYQSSLLGFFKDMEMEDVNKLFNEYLGVAGNLSNASSMTAFAGMGSTSPLLGTIGSDPWEAWYDSELQIIKNRIQNTTQGEEDYYQANLDLFKLMQERAEHLKQKAEDATSKMEESLDAIGETLKLRIAEEQKTQRGDIIYMDVKKNDISMEEISRLRELIKNGDPSAAQLIDTIKQKILGISR